MTTATKPRAKHFCLGALALLVGLVWGADPAAARSTFNTVSKIAFQETDGITTVVIQGSVTPTFTVYKLERPRRLIVDLANTKVKGYEDPVEAETWAVGLITVSRFVDSRSMIARVVIGFRRPASYRVKASGNQVHIRIVSAEKKPILLHNRGRAGSPAIKRLTAAAAALKAQAGTLKKQAQAQKQRAAKLAEQAAAALRSAHSAAHKTRHQAREAAAALKARAETLKAQAETLKTQAAATLSAAGRKEQQIQRLLLAAQQRLVAAKAQAELTRKQSLSRALALESASRKRALAQARALEEAARTRAQAQLAAASQKLAAARRAADLLSQEADKARLAQADASRLERESQAKAVLAQNRAKRLVSSAQSYGQRVARSAATVRRRAQEEAQAARIQARQAQALAKRLARQAGQMSRRAAVAKRHAQKANRALGRATARRHKASREVAQLKLLAARYVAAVGKARREMAALRLARASVKGQLSRLQHAAHRAMAELAYARRLASKAKKEAHVYQRLSGKHAEVQAAISDAKAELARARRAVLEATNSRRREEAKQAVARAARRQAELRLRQLGLAKERVQTSKQLLERRVKALARRSRAAKQARKVEIERQRLLTRAVRQAAKRRARAERMAKREHERMEALRQGRRHLERLTRKLKDAVSQQLQRKRAMEAANERISRLRLVEDAASRARIKQLRRALTKLRAADSREARRLNLMQQSVSAAQAESGRRLLSLKRAQGETLAAREAKDQAMAAAARARQELAGAKAAVKAERAELARMRKERTTVARALSKAEGTLQSVKLAVSKVRSSRTQHQRALVRVQSRLRREQRALSRMRRQMERESRRAEAQRRSAAQRLALIQAKISKASKRSRAVTANRHEVHVKHAELAARQAEALASVRRLESRQEMARARARRLERRLADAKRQAHQLRTRLTAKRRLTRKAERRLEARLAAKKRTLQRKIKALEARLAERNQALKRQEVRLAARRRALKRRALKRRALKRRAIPRTPVRITSRVARVHFVDGVWAHRVVVNVKGPIHYQLGRTAQKSVTVNLLGVRVPRSLERSLDVSEFDGPIRLISTLRSPARAGTVNIVVDLRRTAKYRFSTSGDKLFIDVWKSKTEVARARQRRGLGAVAAGPTKRRVDVSSTRVAAYGAPVGEAPGAGRRQSRRYRRYRYGFSGRYSGPRVDMDFNNADIHNVLRLVGRVWRKNIVVSGGVEGKVTIRLKRVRVDRALEVVLKTLKLGMVWHSHNLIRIALEADIKKEMADIQERAAKARAVEPVYTRIIPLNFAKVKDMKNRVKENMLSKRGAVSADERTNTLIVRDVRANIKAILTLIQRLDKSTPQVLVQARIVEARSTFLREIGIQWGGNVLSSAGTGNPTGLMFPSSVGLAGGSADDVTNTGGLVGSAATNPNYAVNLPATVGTGSGGALGLSLGSVTGAFNINLRLTAMEDSGQVRIISSPKIMVLDNVEANISQGVAIPISVVSAQGVSTKFENAVLGLKVQPRVTNDGNVIMKIEVEKSEPDFVNTGARGDPTILKKFAKTEMMIKDGDTAVIGGIYTRATARNFSKVPWFAEIPIIGWLFKKKKESDERSEVLIFITPRIIKTGTAGLKSGRR